MQSESLEPWESKRLKFLELAAEAIRAAAQSKTAQLRNGYISIANAWLELANAPELREGDKGDSTA